MLRKTIQLTSQLLPRLEHCAGAANEASKGKHGDKKNQLGEVGQGNALSGVAHSMYDTLLGITMFLPNTRIV